MLGISLSDFESQSISFPASIKWPPTLHLALDVNLNYEKSLYNYLNETLCLYWAFYLKSSKHFANRILLNFNTPLRNAIVRTITINLNRWGNWDNCDYMTQSKITMLAEDGLIRDSDLSFQGHTQQTRGELHVEMIISLHFSEIIWSFVPRL